MDGLADRCRDHAVSAHPLLEREFEAALGDSSRLAFRVAFSVLRQREDAEDVAQDVLVKAHRKLGQLRDRTRLRSWIVRMAWRAAIDKRTSNLRREHREQAGVAAITPSAEDLTLESDRARRLWTVIDDLPEKLRLVVVLSSINGHELTEVAAMLRIPEGTVKSRLFEARKQLRERLRDQ